jgi:hypothetical protein
MAVHLGREGVQEGRPAGCLLRILDISHLTGSQNYFGPHHFLSFSIFLLRVQEKSSSGAPNPDLRQVIPSDSKKMAILHYQLLSPESGSTY